MHDPEQLLSLSSAAARAAARAAANEANAAATCFAGSNRSLHLRHNHDHRHQHQTRPRCACHAPLYPSRCLNNNSSQSIPAMCVPWPTLSSRVSSSVQFIRSTTLSKSCPPASRPVSKTATRIPAPLKPYWSSRHDHQQHRKCDDRVRFSRTNPGQTERSRGEFTLQKHGGKKLLNGGGGRVYASKHQGRRLFKGRFAWCTCASKRGRASRAQKAPRVRFAASPV